jgi:hypothetical protein
MSDSDSDSETIPQLDKLQNAVFDLISDDAPSPVFQLQFPTLSNETWDRLFDKAQEKELFDCGLELESKCLKRALKENVLNGASDGEPPEGLERVSATTAILNRNFSITQLADVTTDRALSRNHQFRHGREGHPRLSNISNFRVCSSSCYWPRRPMGGFLYPLWWNLQGFGRE